MKKIVHVYDIKGWEKLKEMSEGSKEIIIFKFSPSCSSSYLSEKVVKEWYNSLVNHHNLICIKIDVIEAKSLSLFIAKQYNIKHESPQIIWLDIHGNVKWHDSHFSITEEALSGLLTNKDN